MDDASIRCLSLGFSLTRAPNTKERQAICKMRATDVVKLPHKRNRRFAYGAIFTGIVIVVLLLLALNRGPISRGFAPEGNGTGLRALCPWCEEGEPITPTDVLGIVLIALVVLALPAGHLALLTHSIAHQPPAEVHRHRACCTLPPPQPSVCQTVASLPLLRPTD